MLESHESEFENLGFFNVIMSSEDIEILEFNQYQKSDKAAFIIYVDLECLTEETDRCKVILKIHLHQYIVGSIFRLVFQCLKYHHLKA